MLHSKNKTGPIVLVSKDIQYTFPFGYAYIAGYLKQQGEDVRVLFRPENPALYKRFAQEIIDLKPLVVGFGTIYPDLYEVERLIKILDKEGRDFPVAIGGQMVTPTPEFAVEVTGVDYGIIGEGEIIFHELVTALRNNESPLSVKGLVVRDGQEITTTGAGDYIHNLSELPSIPYELFPAEKWLNVGRFYTDLAQPHWRYNDRVIPIHGGRGCPFICNFCYHHSKPRYRAIEDMITEADMLIKKFNGNMLYFGDDLVLSSPKRAQDLIQAIAKLNYKIDYSVSCRFDILNRIDDETLKEMKRTGCRIMGLGIESGSQRILDIMNKKITVDEIISGLRRLKDVGILPTVSIMVGQYTETMEDAQQSMDLMLKTLRDNKNIQYAFTIATPFPGSELYDIALQKGLLKDHYDFYKRFDSVKQMSQVSVNLSDMSNEEVEFMRKKLESTYIQERNKIIGSKVVKVENLRKTAKIADSKIRTRIFNRADKGFVKLLKETYVKLYDSIQINLDKLRLKLFGLDY